MYQINVLERKHEILKYRTWTLGLFHCWSFEIWTQRLSVLLQMNISSKYQFSVWLIYNNRYCIVPEATHRSIHAWNHHTLIFTLQRFKTMWSSFLLSSHHDHKLGRLFSYRCRPASLRSPVLWSPAGRTLPPAAQLLPVDPSAPQRPEPVYSGRGHHTAPSSNWEKKEEEETTDEAWTRETLFIQLWASKVCFYFGRNVSGSDRRGCF